MGDEKDAISERSSSDRRVDSSPGYGPRWADARQWAQARLHDRVSSQATSLNGGAEPIDGAVFVVCITMQAATGFRPPRARNMK